MKQQLLIHGAKAAKDSAETAKKLLLKVVWAKIYQKKNE